MYHSYSNLEQQFLNGSLTGGPRVPVAVHPMISNAYVSVLPQDQFINNWETTNLRTISGMHNASPGAADHMVGHSETISAFTASVTGSSSAFFFVVGGLLNQRGFLSTLTATSTGQLESQTDARDIGVITLRKKTFDIGIEPGSLTATVTGTTFGGTDIKGDYFDSGSGAFVRKSDNTSVGVSLPDDGMFVVTASNLREIATSVTSVKYRTRVLNTTLNVFCKCAPNEMAFTFNPTIFMQNAISGESVAAGEIRQSFNNILVHSTLTANTDQAKILSTLVSSATNFSPYITSVGLYDDDYNLLAVAKLTKPMKKPTDLPLTFKVSIDV